MPGKTKRSIKLNYNPAKPKEREPDIMYPWNVDVGPKGRLALHLANGFKSYNRLTTADLLKLPTSELVKSMRMRLITTRDNPPHAEYFAACIDEVSGSPSIDDLQSALQAIIDFFDTWREENAPDPVEPEYRDLAMLDPNSWPTVSDGRRLQQLMEDLEAIICVPILHVCPQCVRSFFASDEGNDFEEDASGYRVRNLFADKRSRMNSYERYVIHLARNFGLLWCRPTRYVDGCSCNESFVQPIDPMETPNGEHCVNGQCTKNGAGPDDYCEMVDGECNTMSS